MTFAMSTSSFEYSFSGVVGKEGLDARRKVDLQLPDLGAHPLGRGHGVGAAAQHDGHGGGGLDLAIFGVNAVSVVIFRPHRNPGHVPEPHLGAVRIHLEQDVLELVDIGHHHLGHQRKGGLLARNAGRAAQGAHSHLLVLYGNGVGHVRRGELVAVQLVVAAMTAYGRIVAEVGVSMMLGGNIKWNTRTITTAITLETGKGDFALGIALGILLLAISFMLNALLSLVRRRVDA